MSVLKDEQGSILMETSAENVLPVQTFDFMNIHHEMLDLEDLQRIVELVGGVVHSESYHV